VVALLLLEVGQLLEVPGEFLLQIRRFHGVVDVDRGTVDNRRQDVVVSDESGPENGQTVVSTMRDLQFLDEVGVQLFQVIKLRVVDFLRLVVQGLDDHAPAVRFQVHISHVRAPEREVVVILPDLEVVQVQHWGQDHWIAQRCGHCRCEERVDEHVVQGRAVQERGQESAVSTTFKPHFGVVHADDWVDMSVGWVFHE